MEGVGKQDLSDEKYKIIVLASSMIETKVKSIYEVCCVEYEQELLNRLSIFAYDLIILENMVGCNVTCRCVWSVRKIYNIPIIVFSDIDDKKALIYAGADIVLEKSCNIAEIQVEVFALMRRWKSGQKMQYKLLNLKNGKLFLNIDVYDAYWNRQELGLSRLEFDFIYFLVLTPGRVYTFEQLYHIVWKQIPVGNVQNVVWCLVKRIRKKMNKVEIKAGKCIANIRGIGYCFKPECTT